MPPNRSAAIAKAIDDHLNSPLTNQEAESALIMLLRTFPGISSREILDAMLLICELRIADARFEEETEDAVTLSR